MKTIRALKIAVRLPLPLMAIVMVVFGIGESIGGDLRGLMHLVPVILVGLISGFAGSASLWMGRLPS